MSAAKTYQPNTDKEMELVKELNPRHVIIDEVILHYGMGKNNPLDKVKFYSKHHPAGMSMRNPDIPIVHVACFSLCLCRPWRYFFVSTTSVW